MVEYQEHKGDISVGEVNFPDTSICYRDDNLKEQEWDFVFTCFEPLVNVTGGIGTYHRLLISDLANLGKSLLILTNSVNADWMPPAGVSVFMVDNFTSNRPYNFVGLNHEKFSLHCHFAFRHLYEKGHRFKFVEFSDYGADGFYSLRARAAGVYDLGTVAVRLHSPNVMLVEDNGRKHSQLDLYRRDIIDREMSVYEDCDVIIFGGDAMRDRVLSLASKFGLNLSAKMEKCPHPYPKFLFDARSDAITVKAARKATIAAILSHNSMAKRDALETARFVGMFGRIEDRKGQYQFISGLLRDANCVSYLKDSNIHFLIAGHNVLDHIGNFRLRDLYELIYQAQLSGHFHFVGRVPQEELAVFSKAVSGFIFASVFENYPNALLEVLPSTKPIAISAHGCMPEITAGFRDVTVFDPLAVNAATIRNFLEGLPETLSTPDRQELANRVALLEARQVQLLEYYCGQHMIRRGETPSLPTVGFVVPIYQDWTYLDETLTSIRAVMRSGDEVVVVDDASDAANFSEIQKICSRHGADLLQLSENSGPGPARLRGVMHVSTDLIQFCDADDLLDKSGINHARQAFANDPGLDMLTGIMCCFQDAHHNWVPRNGSMWTALHEHFAHSGSMFRKAKICRALAVPHGRLPLNEDWLASLLILAQGGKARMLPIVTYYYRRFEGTRSTQNAALVGKVHAEIVEKTFENFSFTSPAQNARLRELITGCHFGTNHVEPSQTGIHFPLRYQVLDAVFFRVVRAPKIEALALWVKRKWMSAKNGRKHGQ